MNVSADYCDDFYNHVCGGFVNSTTIPDDKKGINIFTTLNDKVMKQLNTIINRPSKPEEPKAFKIAKHLYKMCMDTKAIEEQGEKSFLNYFEQLGGWPVLKKDNEWNETLFDWKNQLLKVFGKTYWSTGFFEFNLVTDIKNNSRRVITLGDYSSSLPRNYLLRGLNDESVSNYFNYMVNVSVAFGAEQEQAKKELREALEFEIKLINLTRPSEDYNNQSLAYNLITLGNWEKKYPYFQWKKYLNHQVSPSNLSVNDDEIIIVTNPDYFDQLDKLMNLTPKRTQVNLLIWKEIENTAKYMNEKIIKVYENYVKVTSGRIERPPRWIECTDIVSSFFPIAMSALYVREFFQKKSKDDVEIMVKNIQNQFIKLLNDSSWMDKETKLNAINKAEKMKRLVGYPDELLNNSKLDEYYKVYEDFEMTDDSFIGGLISLSFLNNEVIWSELRQEHNPNKWNFFAQKLSSVNAYYGSSANSIEIPAAILRGEFFNNKLPKYMNYGAIGAIVGHEIMHAFDNRGKQRDANGNVFDWWSNSTNKQYNKKAQCIIDQYGNYTVKEINMNINGVNTQGENIADIGGIKAAYCAYNNWASNNELEKKLPGFNFNPRQMFWISYANTWCSKIRLQTQKLKLTTDSHSPSEFRVNGPLSNIEEFSTDFGCPKGSKMNPEKKCTMW
ncbi:hypothetical protein HCN44_006499 [Aphidius gifuensis]|uniref:Uncharacterized protein n=2 Tax=Aphidius gifuensis TaxID=684658 RepID=A0A834Y1X3_APHGI|nr:hypothetical protein HCN44_006499 [Aphidius gifuensis]